jgi:hypothetical protein
MSFRKGSGPSLAQNFLTLLADLPDTPGPVAIAGQDEIRLPE